MNRPLWLLAPLHTNRRVSLWMALGMLLLTTAIAVGIGWSSHKSDAWVGCVMITAMGLGFAWAFMMSNTALMAIDARQLRLPGIARAIVASLWLYGLACVVLAASGLSLFVGHFVSILMIMALACSGGLLFALLPRFLTLPLCFVPMLLQTIPLSLDVPGPGAAGFVRWAVWMLAAVIVVTGFFWHRLIHSPNPYAQGMLRPLVLQLRRNAGCSGWAGFGRGVDNNRQIQRRPEWMQPQPNLRGCGPDNPRRSLRLALGSPFMPLTAMGWIRQLSFVLVPGGMVALLLIAQSVQRKHALSFPLLWQQGGALVLLWICVFVSMLTAFISLMRVGQLWSKTHAELPLLALLPGLNDASGQHAKRNLLAALLWPALRLPLALSLVTVGILISLGPSIQVLVLVWLAQLGSIGFLLAILPGIIGGRPLPTWAMMLLGMYGCILINISLFVPPLSDPSTIAPGPVPLSHVLLGGWILLAGVLCWQGRRGWQALKQRPHPFLPN